VPEQDRIDERIPLQSMPAGELIAPLDESAAVGTNLIGTHFPSAEPELEFRHEEQNKQNKSRAQKKNAEAEVGHESFQAGLAEVYVRHRYVCLSTPLWPVHRRVFAAINL
jgi:hypothetical protein